MKKKVTYAIMVSVVLLAIAGFLLYAGAGPIYDGCSLDRDVLACLSISRGSGTPFVLILNPVVPLAGQPFEVTVGVDVPPHTQPITVSMVHMQDSTGQTIASWNFINTFSTQQCYGGCSTNFKIKFNAPMSPGNYKLFAIVESGGQRLSQESKSFSVGATQCPVADCNEWQKHVGVQNGQSYFRQCTSYANNFPTCTQTIKLYFYTQCNSGYVVQGTNSNVYSEVKDCVQASVKTPTPVPTQSGGSNGGGSNGGSSTQTPTPTQTPVVTQNPTVTSTPSPTVEPVLGSDYGLFYVMIGVLVLVLLVVIGYKYLNRGGL